MNPKWKKKWIKALRSEKYKQGRGALRKRIRDDSKFCCLGVLCDLVDPTKWRHRQDAKFFTYEGDSANLPMSVKCETGLDGVDMNPYRRRLVLMNDRERCSFSQIADYIEEKL